MTTSIIDVSPQKTSDLLPFSFDDPPATFEWPSGERRSLSVAGIAPDDLSAEPCSLTHDEQFEFEDNDDVPELPGLITGEGVRLSEWLPVEFWTYFDRFIRYWPRKTFHIKYAYDTGFVEKKRRGTDRSLPLFEQLAVEYAERHLEADRWGMWKHKLSPTGFWKSPTPIWLALHMPRYTSVDAIDIDAKQYLLGYYRSGSRKDDPLLPVVHLPLEHFQMLKRIYDAFPGRIWCISSETLGIHAWKKHDRLFSTRRLHEKNKRILTGIGLPGIEAHPMPGRCFRRPFGADYSTITPDGVLTYWTEQVRFFENNGPTPTFRQICRALVERMLDQWKACESASYTCGPKREKSIKPRILLPDYYGEIRQVADWLNAGCPLEPVVARPVPNDPVTSMCREVFSRTVEDRPQPARVDSVTAMCQEVLAETLGEDFTPPQIVEEAGMPTQGSGSGTLPSMRNGKWVKWLRKIATGGLQEENSIGTVAHEFAKWLWWVELYNLPEECRHEEIVSLLTTFVLEKHNGFVSRISNGQAEDVLGQVSRCVDCAAKITEAKYLDVFSRIRRKWEGGQYKSPLRLVPLLRGEEEESSSSPCQLTVMCINFDIPLPDLVRDMIQSKAGRTKVLPFATRLIAVLHNNNGRAFLGRQALSKLLGYHNPNQVAKYVRILQDAGVISRGDSYSKGRNGKLMTLTPLVSEALKGE